MMKNAIFEIPGTWEAALFKVGSAFGDNETAKEVSERGYRRFPIAAAFMKVRPQAMNGILWYFSSAGGRWEIRSDGFYRCFVLRNGQFVIQVGQTEALKRRSTLGFEASAWTVKKLENVRED